MTTELQSSIPPEHIHVGKDGTIYDKREQGMFSHLLTPQPTIQVSGVSDAILPRCKTTLNGKVENINTEAKGQNHQVSTEPQFFTGSDGTIYNMSERGILRHLLTSQPTTQTSAVSLPTSRK